MLTYESLHNHTTASDGQQTYAEVLKTAEANNFGVMAFTDHDMLPSAKDLEFLRAYTGPVKWLLGCEISSGLPKELGGGATSMFHIVGLFTDPTYQPLIDHCKLALASRNERMQRIVANLRSLHFKISVDDCLSASGGESVGRPHIVKALNAHPENTAVMNQLKQQMEQDAINDPSVAMKLVQMGLRHESDAPYALFLSEDSYVPGIYVDYLYSLDMDAGVKLIREAGGIALVAHWPTIKKKINVSMLDQFLAEGRLDGLELRSGFYDSAVEGDEQRQRQLVDKHGAYWTYGIDGHSVEDIERFGRDTALAGKTVGQTQRLIKRLNPDLSYSNL